MYAAASGKGCKGSLKDKGGGKSHPMGWSHQDSKGWGSQDTKGREKASGDTRSTDAAICRHGESRTGSRGRASANGCQKSRSSRVRRRSGRVTATSVGKSAPPRPRATTAGFVVWTANLRWPTRMRRTSGWRRSLFLHGVHACEVSGDVFAGCFRRTTSRSFFRRPQVVQQVPSDILPGGPAFLTLAFFHQN